MFRRLVSLGVLAAVVFAGRPASAEDEWLGSDKALHFAAAAVISGGAYGVSALVLDGRTGRAAVGASAAIVAGAGKELYDLTGRGDPSWKDFTWDLIGTAVGVSVALLVDYAVRGPRAGDGGRTGVTQGALVAW